MTRLVSQVIASAQGTLNDDAAVRYTQAEQIGFIVDALNLLKNTRPDLFVGQYSVALPTTMAVGDELPLPDQFFRPLVDYVIARCETKDAEHVNSGRAELMAKMTGGFLK